MRGQGRDVSASAIISPPIRRSDIIREQFWFIQWGEIVDNVSCYAYLDDDLVIVLAFRKEHHPLPADLGKVFVARLGPDEFVAAIEGAADLIDVES
jgi:hypothetical protein